MEEKKRENGGEGRRGQVHGRPRTSATEAKMECFYPPMESEETTGPKR